jgi:hypothetical protein
MPRAANQQPTSPDLTTATTDLHQRCNWETKTALSSDHLPIIITFNTGTSFRLVQHRRTYTNYKKANWEDFTEEIETGLTNAQEPTDVHQSNRIIVNLIKQADKHHIPKGKIKDSYKLLPEHIRDTIAQRDLIRIADPTDHRLTLLNEEINGSIREHKTNIWKEHLDDQWDHKTNTHVLWNTIAGLSNKKPTQEPNSTIKFGNKIAKTPLEKAHAFNNQFINSVVHKTCNSNRKIDKTTKKLATEPIEILKEQTTAAIKQAKNNNSTGPQDINIKHLKHLCTAAVEYLTKIFNLAINQNIIPHKWKVAKIIPIPKAGKYPTNGSAFRPISLLSPIAKTLEKIILHHLTDNMPVKCHQHGFKTGHSTTSALQIINNQITDVFNKKAPPERTVAVALDMSKAFDTVKHHRLIDKIHKTNTPAILQKFIANYIKGRNAYTFYNGQAS